MDLATLVALIGVIAAIAGLIFQSRITLFSLRVQLLLQIEKDFNGEDMQKIRRAAARWLKLQAGSGSAELDQVLDFFDGVGLLVRKGALDTDMIWNNLSFYALCYWHASRAHVAATRQSEQHYWEHYEHLAKRLSRISALKGGTRPVFPQEKDLAYFYDVEMDVSRQKRGRTTAIPRR